MAEEKYYHKYTYSGPVILSDKLVANHWVAETLAISEKKARSNIAYQIRNHVKCSPRARVSLPGTLVMTEENSLRADLV